MLFSIAKIRKQPKCPLKNDLNKQDAVYLYNKYCVATRIDEILPSQKNVRGSKKL